MVIRPAAIEDSQALSNLILKAAESVRGSDFSADGWKLLEQTNTADAFRKRFHSDSYFALICEIEGEPAGYIAIVDFEKIEHMFVLPQFRRLGISSKLWEQAKKICVESGHGSYYWVRSSTVAERIYESFGFRLVGERETASGISSQFMEMGVTNES